MKGSVKRKTSSNYLRTYTNILFLVWTILILIFGFVDVRQLDHEALNYAKAYLEVKLESATSYPAWFEVHKAYDISDNPVNSIKIPSSETNKLKSDEKLLNTPGPLKKNVSGIGSLTTPVITKIININPINPNNKADYWEAQALRSFEKGESSAVSIIEKNGQEYFKMMRVLYADKNCVACHQNYGSTSQAILGGISLSIPLDNIRALFSSSRNTHIVLYVIIWLVGLLLIFGGYSKIKKNERNRINAENDLRNLNANLETEIISKTEDLNKRISELNSINEINTHLSKSILMSDFVNTVINELSSTTGADLVMIFKRENDKLILMGSGPKNSTIQHNSTPEHVFGECLCGQAASMGTAKYSIDIHSDIRCTWNECKDAGIKSFAALPLINKDGVIGVLGIASVEEKDFERFAVFIETIAQQIAYSLANSMLHQDITEFANSLETEIVARKKAERQKSDLEAESWSLFEEGTTPIWIEDFSLVKNKFDELKANGVTDLKDYFEKDNKRISELACLVKPVKMNKISLKIFETDEDELSKNIANYFTDESLKVFAEELIALFNGEYYFSSELPIMNKNNQLIYISFSLTIPTPFREDFRKTIFSFLDITEMKMAEIELLELNSQLESRVKERTLELEKNNLELERMNKLFVGRELRMVELKNEIKEISKKHENE